MKHSASVITAPPLVGGLLFGLAAYLIGYAVDPARALIGAGVGIVVGFLVVSLFWWNVYERWTVPRPARREMQVRAVEAAPVDIRIVDGDNGNVTRIIRLESINDRQLYDIANDCMVNGVHLTYRNLKTIGLNEQEIALLHKELIARRMAYKPGPNSALRLTDRGHELMRDAVQSLYPKYSPTPRQSQRANT